LQKKRRLRLRPRLRILEILIRVLQSGLANQFCPMISIKVQVFAQHA
jgi:hypothetical protein